MFVNQTNNHKSFFKERGRCIVKIKSIVAGIMAISLVGNMGMLAFADVEDVAEVTEAEVVQEVEETEAVVEEQAEETEADTEKPVAEETEEVAETEGNVEETSETESTDVSETEETEETTELVNETVGDYHLDVSMSCSGSLSGSVIDNSNACVYINGQYIGGFGRGDCVGNWVANFGSWQEGETVTVEVSGLSKYVGSVYAAGGWHTVVNGYVSFEFACETYEDVVLKDGYDFDEIYREDGEYTEEEYAEYFETVKAIVPLNITCNTVSSCLFLQVLNADGSVASGAKVQGYFRAYTKNFFDEDETLDYIETAPCNYTADNRGIICVQGTAYDTYQQFVYEVSCGEDFNAGATNKFKLGKGANHLETVYLIDSSELPVWENTQLMDSIAEAEKEIQNSSLVTVQAITSFRNVDDTFVKPEDISVSFLNKETGDEFEFSVDAFGTTELGQLPEGTYNVQYIGDSYFGVDGVHEITVTGNEVVDVPIAVTAKYLLELHRVRNGREIQWSIQHPLTGELIVHTGVMTFAIMPGMHFYLTDGDGNSYDVALGMDMDGVFFDMETGFAEFFDADGLSDSNINEIPQTGDALTTVVGVTLGIAAAGGITYAVTRKKKKTAKTDENKEEEFDIL